jgi:hypothetical protein
MNPELEAIVQRMIDAGESEDNIALVIREYQPAQPKAPRSAIEMLGEAEAVNTHPEFMQGQAQAGGKFANLALPIAGGIVGGIPGAAAGAAAGGILDRASGGRPITARGTITDAALGAAGQAAGPLIGKGIQKAGRLVGRGLVRASVRPSAAVRRDFGGSAAVADALLDERVATSAGAGRKIGESARETTALLQQAAPTSTPIRPAELLDDALPVAERSAMRGRLGMVDDTADDIMNRLARMERANPNGIDLTDAQDLKREAQDLATRVYRARAMGNDVTNLSAETDEAVAKGLRKAIEARVPAVGPQNARTQRLIGVQRALGEAEDRPHNLTDMLALLSAGGSLASGHPGPLVAGMAVRALASPRAGASAGIAANELGKALGNPTTSRAALLAALLSGDTE